MPPINREPTKPKQSRTSGALDMSVFNTQPAGGQTVANSQTPQQFQSTPSTPGSFTVDVPETIQTDAISQGTGLDDVLAARQQAEAEVTGQTAAIDANTAAREAIDTDPAKFFGDPTAEIQAILNADPTEAEQEYQATLQELANEARSIDEQITAARERGEEKTGLFDLQKQLNETNTTIARKEAALRRNLRAFDKDPSRRGVARGFFRDQRAKLEADATAELADLYIIQNAQSGNVQRAESYINTAVENKYKSVQAELTARQYELKAQENKLAGEAKDENLRLQLALSERQAQIADKKEQEKSIREFAITAAQNGADNTVIQNILSSGSIDAGLAMASPYIGRYERLKVESSLANAAIARRANLLELARAGDPNAISQLGQFGIKIGEELTAAQIVADLQKNRQIDDELVNVDNLLNAANYLRAEDAGRGLATGEFRSPYGAAFATNVPAGAVGGFAAGSVVPGLGNVAGTVLGTVAGVGTSVYQGSKLANEKQDFLNQAKFLSENISFAKFIDLKSQGVAFGGTAVAELRKVDAAASALSASLISDPVTGEAIRISGSEEEFMKNLAIVEKGLSMAKNELQANRLSDDATAAILSAYQSQP